MKPTTTNDILKAGMRAMFNAHDKAGAYQVKAAPMPTGYAKALVEQKAKRGIVDDPNQSSSNSGDAA